MKKSKLPVLRLVGVVLIAAFFLAAHAFAAPADEISHAVARHGAGDIRHADPAAFLKAYRSVLKKTANEQMPSYITAAIGLRPDLAGPITETSVHVWAAHGHGTDGRKILTDDQISCDEIDRIIRAAVLADSKAAPAIVRAALAAAPYARECIVAAAIAAAPDQRVAIQQAAAAEPEPPGEGPPGVAFNGPTGVGQGGIGTINPTNIGGGTGGLVVSQTGP
jgi:hypothetical protein